MSAVWVRNLLRIFFFILIQVLVFKHITMGPDVVGYFHLLVYPTTILLLPIDTPKVAVMIIAFAIGLTVDVFYDSLGVHAGALVFMAFLRSWVLRAMAPDNGYAKNAFPVAPSFGLLWFVQYSGVLLFAFIFAYFSLEAFTFVYIKSILIKTFLSFIASFILVVLHQILVNPRY